MYWLVEAHCLQEEYSWPQGPRTTDANLLYLVLSTHLCPSASWFHKAGTTAFCTLGLKKKNFSVFFNQRGEEASLPTAPEIPEKITDWFLHQSQWSGIVIGPA